MKVLAYFLKYQKPSKSAKNHPIGTDHQIPVTPNGGREERKYAKATRTPRDTTVKTTEISGFPIAR